MKSYVSLDSRKPTFKAKNEREMSIFQVWRAGVVHNAALIGFVNMKMSVVDTEVGDRRDVLT